MVKIHSLQECCGEISHRYQQYCEPLRFLDFKDNFYVKQQLQPCYYDFHGDNSSNVSCFHNLFSSWVVNMIAIKRSTNHQKNVSFFLTKAWRSCNDGGREALNGDASSSSLTAKGFRSVRPNLQDKKSPTQVKLNTPTFMFWHLKGGQHILDGISLWNIVLMSSRQCRLSVYMGCYKLFYCIDGESIPHIGCMPPG